VVKVNTFKFNRLSVPFVATKERMILFSVLNVFIMEQYLKREDSDGPVECDTQKEEVQQAARQRYMYYKKEYKRKTSTDLPVFKMMNHHMITEQAGLCKRTPMIKLQLLSDVLAFTLSVSTRMQLVEKALTDWLCKAEIVTAALRYNTIGGIASIPAILPSITTTITTVTDDEDEDGEDDHVVADDDDDDDDVEDEDEDEAHGNNNEETDFSAVHVIRTKRKHDEEDTTDEAGVGIPVPAIPPLPVAIRPLKQAKMMTVSDALREEMIESGVNILQGIPSVHEFNAMKRSARQSEAIKSAFKEAVTSIRSAISAAYRERTTRVSIKQPVKLSADMLPIWLQKREYITSVLSSVFAKVGGYRVAVLNDGCIYVSSQSLSGIDL
jgi:hypothetical protein